MIVFIGNLPAEVSAHDLAGLGRLTAATPVRIHKKKAGNGGLYRYGLVYLYSVKDGRKLIRRLDGTGLDGIGLRAIGLDGTALVARQFEQRHVSNERRRLDWRRIPWHGPERRKGERRLPDN